MISLPVRPPNLVARPSGSYETQTFGSFQRSTNVRPLDRALNAALHGGMTSDPAIDDRKGALHFGEVARFGERQPLPVPDASRCYVATSGNVDARHGGKYTVERSSEEALRFVADPLGRLTAGALRWFPAARRSGANATGAVRAAGAVGLYRDRIARRLASATAWPARPLLQRWVERRRGRGGARAGAL